jgi:hypothetical protein
MEDEVASLLHNKEPVKPDAVNKVLPQLSVTVITGIAGLVFGAAMPLPGALIQPFTD